MEKLKSFYTMQAESQPEPTINITFEPLAEKTRLNPVYRVVLAAAVVVLLTGTALAASSGLLMRIPEWIGGLSIDGSKTAVVEGYSLPFSDEFRAYIDAGDWMREDSWDGENSYLTFAEDLELTSLASVSEFFNVQIAQNSLIPIENNDVYKVLVGYDPIFHTARIFVFSNSILNGDKSVSVTHRFGVSDDVDEIINFSSAYYDHLITEEVMEYYYTSPVNGIEALMLPYSPRLARAVFSLDNIIYELHIEAGIMQLNDNTPYNLDIGVAIDAVELLKEIIDSYHR
jgi:hypothetical protein